MQRLRLFPFERTFVPQSDLRLMSDPAHYKLMDESSRTRNARDTGAQPRVHHQAWRRQGVLSERTKILGAKYLEENDDLRWFSDVFERVETQPIEHFRPSRILAAYKASEDYDLMSKHEKRAAKEVRSSPTSRERAAEGLSRCHEGARAHTRVLKQNHRVGLVHWKRKTIDDDSVDDFGERREPDQKTPGRISVSSSTDDGR